MSFDRNHDERVDRLQQQLRLAPALTPDLVREMAAEVCTRLPTLAKAGKAGHIDRLITAGAWSDVALALIEIELPAWKLCRLVHEDDEWFCSLSRNLNLPLAIDDTADARHEILPLAILCAFIEARLKSRAAGYSQSTPALQNWFTPGDSVCCDNFA